MNDTTISQNLKCRNDQKRKMYFSHKRQTVFVDLSKFVKIQVRQMLHKNILWKGWLLIDNFIVLRNKNRRISFKFWNYFHLMIYPVSTSLDSFVIVWLEYNYFFILFPYLSLLLNLWVLFFHLLNFSHFLLTDCQ